MSLNRGTRVRTLTEKGLQYKMEVVKKNFIAALDKWNRQYRVATKVLSGGSTDIEELKESIVNLNRTIQIVASTYQLGQEYLDEIGTNQYTKAMSHNTTLVHDLHLKIKQLEPKVDPATVSNPLETPDLDASAVLKGTDVVIPKLSSQVVKDTIDVVEQEIEVEQDVALEQEVDVKVESVSKSRHVSRHASVSHRSSNRSNRSNQFNAAVVKAAEARARLLFVEQEAEQRKKLEVLELNRDLAVAEAVIDVLNEEDDGISVLGSSAKRMNTRRYVNSLRSNRSVVEPPVVDPVVVEHKPLDAKTILTHARMPITEPSVFTGDPLKYADWQSSFDSLVETEGITAVQKIHYLKKYVGHPASECIAGYFYVYSDQTYTEARAMLNKRYGNSFKISMAFRNKLEAWPKVQNRDSEGLRRFADFLGQCLSALGILNTLQVLNDEKENQRMLRVLPDWVTTRWARIAAKYVMTNECYPPFKKFVEFIREEADLACDPITSLQSLKPETQKVSTKVVQSSFATSTKAEKPVSTSNHKFDSTQRSNTGKWCRFCKRDTHKLDDCRTVRSKPYEERIQFIKSQGICFTCLEHGHLSATCSKTVNCTVCKSSRHTTLLHKEFKPKALDSQPTNGVPKVQNSASTMLADVGQNLEAKVFTPGEVSHRSHITLSSSRFSSSVVPVWLSHNSNPNTERLVYCILDNQSSSSFLLDKTAKSLNMEGVQVNLTLSTMLAEDSPVMCGKVSGLRVRPYVGQRFFNLPAVYTRSIMPAQRHHIPVPEMVDDFPYLQPIRDHIAPLQDCEVGLLIGYNCSKMIEPRNVIPSVGDGPYAQRTLLGWSIIGTVERGTDTGDRIGVSHRIICSESVDPLESSPKVQFTLQTKVKDVICPMDIVRTLEQDFNDCVDTSDLKYSVDDKKFIQILKDNITTTECGKYEMPLPFKSDIPPDLPDSRPMALKRLVYLKKRLLKDEAVSAHYVDFMNTMFEKGFAEKVPLDEIDKGAKCSYIPHHGVYNPQKPGKIRVVFDCSARVNGTALNDVLLQGPDLMNNLLGILCRFRKERVAVSCDIEKMFYQFRVKKNHRDYLRFLWWPEGDVSKDPVIYRMRVPIFGAVSSPGSANYGLQEAAREGQEEFGEEAAKFVTEDFYVDDGLTSVKTDEEAIDLVSNTQKMCAKKGIRLHKFTSNSQPVLDSIPVEDRSQSIQNLTFGLDDSVVERTLGIEWSVLTDCFGFKVVLKDKPANRRGILSIVSSVYDPLGFVAPFILRGKQLLQDLCRSDSDWDAPVSEELDTQWLTWKLDVLHLNDFSIDRCIRPAVFADVSSVEFHHFSDASTVGYGQCSYARLFDVNGKVHVSFLMGKARVAPLKQISIPRLELAAAVVSCKIGQVLNREYKMDNVSNYYYTDSMVVLGYINNDAKRFHTFVANRVQTIRDLTTPEQWMHVVSEENPADLASRGASAKSLTTDSMWLNGPSFLWDPEYSSVSSQSTGSVEIDDPELRKSVVVLQSAVEESRDFVQELARFSSWYRLKKVIALCLKFIRRLRTKVELETSLYDSVCVQDLQEAEVKVIQLVQGRVFSEEISELKSQTELDKGHTRLRKRTNDLFRLNCFIGDDTLIRVGGRLANARIAENQKCPVILPKSSVVTDLVIRHCHEKAAHQGKGTTMNEIRSQGYWIVSAGSKVASFVNQCVTCRKIRGKLQDQKMADLPSDRVNASPCFTYCGCDYFGPFLVKQGRKEIKRYGVIFTCMYSRAIHIEVAESLTTDSFISALRRFISIRGQIKLLRCDNATNFVGAKNALAKSMNQIESDEVREFLLKEGCDFENKFCFNVPTASHMAGVWERLIRIVRNILQGILSQQGTQLRDEELRTVMCEAAAIANSRPLCVENIGDPTLKALCPNHLLTMKYNVVISPPGEFEKTDLYVRQRWQRIQYLAQQFWSRFKTEYLVQLQVRHKWTHPRRNLEVGDIVILKDETVVRESWPLAKVVEVYPSDDGLVRSINLQMGTCQLDSNGKRTGTVSYLKRPVHKVVLLLGSY